MPKPTREEREEALRDQGRQSHRERGKRAKGSLAEQVLRTFPLDVEWFQMRTGRNLNEIDIVPFFITQEWFKDMKMKAGRVPEAKTDVGYLSYKLEVPCHRGVGPNNEWWLCVQELFGKPCVMCEERRAEFEKPRAEQDEKVWRPLMPSWRCFYNVYDYNNVDLDIHPFEISYAHFEDPLQGAVEMDEDEEIHPWSPTEGLIVEFKAKEESWQGRTYNKPLEGSFTFADRDEPYSDEDLERAWSFDKYLYIPKYDELASAYYGVENLGDVGGGGDDEEEAESPRERRRSRSRKREPEDEEPDDDRPARREGRKRKGDDEVGECPVGGQFGHDCNELDECSDCPDDIFDKCAEVQDKLKKEEETEPPEEKKEKKKPKPKEKKERKRTRGKKEEKKPPAKSRRRPRRTT